MINLCSLQRQLPIFVNRLARVVFDNSEQISFEKLSHKEVPWNIYALQN
eukprot:Gb_15244 [translate_table: standard]